MTDAPEQMWIADVSPAHANWHKAFTKCPEGEYQHHYKNYIRADLAKAQAGALLRQAADVATACERQNHARVSDSETHGVYRAGLEAAGQAIAAGILAIDTDAQAALDRYVQEVVERATAKLRHNIQEATDAAFIFGAMDNVADIDATLEEFANAVSGAIRAAIGGEA